MKKNIENYFDKHWHLATSDDELALTELEFSLFRSFEAFSRWQSECLATVTGQAMSSTDNAILHLIRMRRRPKSIKEIAMLFNRDDMPNLQYSVRKLQKSGFIKKENADTKKRGVRYMITDQGVEVTDAFAEIRKKILVKFAHNLVGDMSTVASTLELMTGIYDQSARIAITHRSNN